MNDIVKIIMMFLVINIIVDPFSLRYILRNKLIEYVDKKVRGQNIVYAYINFIELSIAPLKALMVDVKNAKLLFYMIMSQMVAVSYFVINLSAIMYMKQIGQLVFSVDMNIISIIIMDIVFVGLISSCLHLYVTWLHRAYQKLVNSENKKTYQITT